MVKYEAYVRWHSGIRFKNGEFEEYEDIIQFEAENAEKAHDYVTQQKWIKASYGETITITHYYVQTVR